MAWDVIFKKIFLLMMLNAKISKKRHHLFESLIKAVLLCRFPQKFHGMRECRVLIVNFLYSLLQTFYFCFIHQLIW